MRVLAVTGKLAESIVRESLKDFSSADVLVVDIDVAAFITPSHLRKVDLSAYDLVLVPGLTAGADWKELEKEKGVKIRLGTIHAYDLRFLLPMLGSFELSHKVPACKFILSKKREEVLRDVDGLERDFSFKIGNVSVGGNSRMKVVAEIVSATRMDEGELKDRIRYYELSGADIIDLGVPLEENPDKIEKAVMVARETTDLPLSVDTFDVTAIKTATDCGIDMVMSITKSNLKALDFVEDQAVVVVDRNIAQLVRLVEIVREVTDKVIADPVLDPFPKISDSILRYHRFREIDEKTPILFGAGNVTELSDMDSIGLNGFMAMIAEELSANLIFTTEASPKTVGSVKELAIATYLVKGAKIRKTPPKDLGINLFAIKEKTKFETCPPKNYIIAKELKSFFKDPCGDFKIWVHGDMIVCEHEEVTIVGRRAKEIYDTVVSKKLISRMDHACYLGRELMKAELSLLLKKNYLQDQDVDFGIFMFENPSPIKPFSRTFGTAPYITDVESEESSDASDTTSKKEKE
jgi:dihydropteroate synthase-like protein